MEMFESFSFAYRMEILIWVLLAHYIADYPLQGDFLATTKGKYWYSLFVHSMIYAGVLSVLFKLIGVFALWKFLVLLVSHIYIDYKKATAQNKDYALTWYLYADQICHIIINIALIIIS